MVWSSWLFVQFFICCACYSFINRTDALILTLLIVIVIIIIPHQCFQGDGCFNKCSVCICLNPEKHVFEELLVHFAVIQHKNEYHSSHLLYWTVEAPIKELRLLLERSVKAAVKNRTLWADLHRRRKVWHTASIWCDLHPERNVLSKTHFH